MLRIAASVMLGVLLNGCAPELGDGLASLPSTTRPTAEPAGFIRFCLRFPEQCTSRPEAARVLPIDPQDWRLLNTVNRAVNAEIRPEDDEEHYGRPEYWTIPTDGLGDCDDYAVTKRKRLIDAGIPAPALRLAVVISPTAGRHAVLTVTTDKGDFVLDDLTDEIVRWDSTGYSWIERQDAANPMTWVSLQPIAIAAAVPKPAQSETGETRTIARRR